MPKIIFDQELKTDEDRGEFLGRLLDYFTTGNEVRIIIEKLDKPEVKNE